MQISLRSQLIAGATALVGATAVAMTPIAPAVQLPALSTSNAAVALAAYANPFSALYNSVNLGIDYVINGNYNLDSGGGATNWPAAGISDYTNSVLPYAYWNDGGGYLPAITNIGLIPNLITVPFPVGTQVVNNWIGYVNTAYQAGAQVINAGLNLLWAPVGLGIAVVQDIVSGNFADIPVQIQATLAYAVAQIQGAVQAVVGGATVIAANFVAKATAAVQVLAAAIPAALANLPLQLGVVAAVGQTAITNITTALSTGNVEGAWNAAVAGLLSPTGVPGSLVNLTLGAGVQTGEVTDSATYYANVVPSVRNEVQTLGQGLSIALSSTAVSPAASVRSAAAKTATAAPVAAAAAAAEGTADVADAEAPVKKATAKVGRHAAAARAAAAK
ncbi:MAG: hypothetical protein ACR2JI_15645 [Mycobacterium sp.]